MRYVTHDQVEAMTMASKIVALQAGRVEQVGTPLRLYHQPANLFVAGFVGSPRMNMLPGRITGTDATGVTVELVSGARLTMPVDIGAARIGNAVTVGIRPEALTTHSNGELAGEVQLVERLGGLTLLHVGHGADLPLIVQTDGGDGTLADSPIRFAVDAAACHVFAADGSTLPHLATYRLVV